MKRRLDPAGWAETTWSMILLAIGAFVLGSAWDGWIARLVMVAAAVVPALIVRLLHRRTSAWFAVVIVLVLLVGIVVLLGRGAREDGTSALAALIDAVPTLLTGPLPAPLRPELLAPGVLLAGTVGALVGVRLVRERRHRVSPVAGAVLLYAAGLALTAATTDPVGIWAMALTVMAVAGWVLLSRRRETRAGTAASVVREGPTESAARQISLRSPGKAVRAAAALALISVPLVAAGALPSRDDALDLREHVDPPVLHINVTNPLPQLAAWAKDPEKELFAVTGDVYPLHLAVLSSYDGASWSAPSSFRPLDITAARILPAGERRAVVRAKVRLIDIPNPWLPAPGDPDTIDLKGSLVDPNSGSTIAPGSRAGTAYSVSGSIDAPTAEALKGATLLDPAQTSHYLEVPRLPAVLRSYAEGSVKNANTPLEKALAIEAAVRGTRVSAPTAPAGSSYRRIEQFLLGDKGTAGAQTGTAEQFATSFAVLGRAVGLPTRVVVGFEPGEVPPGSTTGERIVRGQNATAWPEVYFAGQGWVPFSPTPDAAGFGPDLQDDTPITPPQPTDAVPPPDVQTDNQNGAGSGTIDEPLSPWVLAGIVGTLVIIAIPLVLLLIRRARRTRQRALGARGAWDAVLDAALVLGDRDPSRVEPRSLAHRLDVLASTTSATSRSTDPTRSGAAAAAGGIVRTAEAHAFGPSAASGQRTRRGSAADDDAWARLRDLERGLRRQAPLARRLTWHLNPAPLRRARNEKRNIPPKAGWTAETFVTDDGDRRWSAQGPGART